MARTKGMLNLSGNLEVNAGAPLDARTVVPTLADLTVASNFQYKYVGMPVVVQATGDMYILTANDVTVEANWKKVGSGGGGGTTYTAGDGIDITNDEISVKAGSNLSVDSSGNLNATDTTYTAGTGIDIENNEISTDNMPAADMSEIVTPLPSVMSRLPRYSTEEQVVAYWIDGKPLYQKTLTGNTGSITDGTAKTIDLGLIDSNADKNFIISAFLLSSGGDISCLSYIQPVQRNRVVQVYCYNKHGYIRIDYKDFENADVYMTVQYTKTTD